MKILTATIVSDESGRPVSVNMDYNEFLRVKGEVEGTDTLPDEATALENYRRMIACEGTVKWDEDPVEYRQRLRDEWN